MRQRPGNHVGTGDQKSRGRRNEEHAMDVTDTATEKPAVTHTPGPWTFEEIDERSRRELHIDSPAFWIVGNSQTSDEVVGTVEAVDVEQARVDARLIAAAPELLAELKSMTDRFERCVIGSGTDPEFAAEAVKNARIVIAKAEGRS